MTGGPEPAAGRPDDAAPRFCGECGAALRPGAHFCPACGASATPDATAAPPPTFTAKKPAPPPSPAALLVPAAAPEAPARGNGRLVGAVVGGVVLLAVVAVLVIILTGQDPDDDVTATGGDRGGATTGDDADEGSPPPTEDRSDAAATTVTEPEPVSTVIQPNAAVASNEREAVSSLLCTGLPLAYSAGQLIDGDPQTGWGASSTDATGESITVSFAGERHLTSVGLTPGYLRVAPRDDQGCRDVSAFPYNRFVTSVEYRFDDGTTANQTFTVTPELQTMPVDVVTRSVTITILGTRHQGWDDDTVLSEAEFEGYVE